MADLDITGSSVQARLGVRMTVVLGSIQHGGAYVDADNAILRTLKMKWDDDTASLTGGVVPQMVYEFLEPDMKPHPRDGKHPWARVVIRHNDATKATMSNSEGMARYRRFGLVWVQVFVPATSATSWMLAQQLASVAQLAYEGKRASGGNVVFTKAQVVDKAREGAWVCKDMKAWFYWDEIH
jgi:hypothetical protein